jgi:hypothetical protein
MTLRTAVFIATQRGRQINPHVTLTHRPADLI